MATLVHFAFSSLQRPTLKEFNLNYPGYNPGWILNFLNYVFTRKIICSLFPVTYNRKNLVFLKNVSIFTAQYNYVP